MKDRIILQQERDFGSKINATFAFIKQEFKPLLTCFAYIVLPISLLSGVAYGIYNTNLYTSMGFAMQEGVESGALDIFQTYRAMFSGVGLLMICLYWLSHVLLFTVILSYMKLYKAGQTNITPTDVWNEGVRHLPKLVVLYILVIFMAIAGTVLFILPGIYIAIALSLSTSIMIMEDSDIPYTITESFSITRGKWWSTFGLLFVLGLIAGVLSLAFSLPITIYSSTLILSPENASRVVSSFLGMIYTTGSFFLYALIIVGSAFQYFNLHERKYATRLNDDIESLGKHAEE